MTTRPLVRCRQTLPAPHQPRALAPPTVPPRWWRPQMVALQTPAQGDELRGLASSAWCVQAVRQGVKRRVGFRRAPPERRGVCLGNSMHLRCHRPCPLIEQTTQAGPETRLCGVATIHLLGPWFNRRAPRLARLRIPRHSEPWLGLFMLCEQDASTSIAPALLQRRATKPTGMAACSWKPSKTTVVVRMVPSSSHFRA